MAQVGSSSNTSLPYSNEEPIELSTDIHTPTHIETRPSSPFPESPIPPEVETEAATSSQPDANETDDTPGTSATDRLIPSELRERTARHIGNIGRHFNILDRVFRRRSNNTEDLTHHPRGEGFDGVFRNLTAKPEANDNAARENQNDTPPTYDEAAADMVPSYYGMDMSSEMYADEICIEGLPVGNIANLFWNIIVSTSFQFIGFLITYILHTSHAAKQGSRFGLGLTFIGYAYSMIPNNVTSKVGKDKSLNRLELSDPNSYDDLDLSSATAMSQDNFQSNLSHGMDEEKHPVPILAISVGLLGLFISIKSIIDYINVKKLERKYMSQDQV
ncbi:Bsd2p NDAI_0K01910 [Naumovozyma dairenensis CBS 421]|uniref:Metal homeostatis protein BSD2 n=1 Tax=Naumovozyma dairenensis (strain ATCC 10597 / BCRC 20456 / CBS 421 / NBRC 0211 / NRRL Y-12639) TaxID=1071378 RepID=G0WHX1_NAUDC|nr:hypothetical protein NDAI_0K01910 [Naumovozyma dairenensis CBS 421]CCD27382.1 hypothetical protein NDAI_0K01910 [Naumovozyma dairenensis CBS 421]